MIVNSEVMRRRMRQKGACISSLAKASHISRNTVSRVIHEKSCTEVIISSIASALDCNMKDLLKEE